jgi:ABC-type lipoprotein export system ATPase subunit
MASPLYALEKITFDYRLGATLVRALSSVDLTIPHGAFLCLRGPSGSGKSTLLALIGLIEQPQQGQLRLEGRDVSSLRESEKNDIRKRKLGFVFQSFHLNRVLRGDENVEYFLARQHLPRAERRERVEDALREVGMWEHRRKRPLEMSGGQCQRIAIARALAKRPAVLIADEPTANLDSRTGSEIVEILHRANAVYGVAVILASHDPMVYLQARSIVELHDGCLTAGSPGG